MNSGEFPKKWKYGHWSAVFKKNESFLKENYRPISLLSCISKVFERIVFNDLYSFCIANNILTPKNSGFKLLDSTVYQLIHIVDKIHKGLDDKKDACMVFLDISKAFDKVYHKGLLFKLRQFGIAGNLYSWLESYLTDRYSRVVLSGKKSEWRILKAGVPQGSILGPLLFLIFINDIVINIGSFIYLFADDTTLLHFKERMFS